MGKLAFLFPGQGAQSIGMGRQLSALPEVQTLYDRAAAILGYDLAKLCFEGPTDELDSTVHSQPALFVTSLAALEALRRGSPDVVESCEAAAGLSLGEYTALAFAGAIEFEEGLDVVRQRGEAMQAAADATASGMVSVLGLQREVVEQICDGARQEGETLEVANLLCPGNIVISGDAAACQRASEAALNAGAMKTVPLAVAGAFHTPLMQPAVERLAQALEGIRITRPRLPVISNVTAQPVEDPDEIRQLLVQQVVSPVRWEDSMRYLLDHGYDHFYEVGPGRVLRGLLRRMDRRAVCESVEC